MKILTAALTAALLTAGGAAFAMCNDMARPETPPQTTADSAPIVLPQPPAAGT
jgi:hypothetical protein